MKKANSKINQTGSFPLQNKRKEVFCGLYAFEFWGRAAEAALNAGYKLTSPVRLRALLADPEIRSRIRFLRKQIAEQTVADEAWIQKHFIEIAVNADKPGDKLRALAALYRATVEREKGSCGELSEIERVDDPFAGFNFDGGDQGL